MSKEQSLQSPQPAQLSPQEQIQEKIKKGMIADLKGCITTNTTKAQAIEGSAYTSYSLIDGKYNSSMSTIEGLGARAMMSFLPPEEIQSFVDNIHAAETVHRSFITDKVDAEKGRLSAAKTEAALKGYVLPLSDGAPYELIKTEDMKGNLTEAEKDMAFAAGREALLTVANKSIPTADYAKAVQDEYARIISRDHPELEQERLEVLKEYASCGVKKKQGQNLSPDQFAEAREAARETSKEFSKIFASHKDKMQDPGPDVILESNLQRRFVEEIVQKKFTSQYMIDPETSKELESLITEKVRSLDASSVNSNNIQTLTGRFEEELLAESPRLIVLKAINAIEKKNGINVSENQAKIIVDKLSPSLAMLDPEYLKENSQVITDQIQKAIMDRSTVTLNALGGLYIREAALEKVSNELLGIHSKAYDIEQKLNIEKSLLSLSMSNSKLAEKLTVLGVEKAKAAKYDAAKISEDDFVKMRRENPELFDKIILKRNEPAPDLTAVINGIVVQAVYKLQKENGVKLTSEEVVDLTKQIQANLTPALSKLDPEFLYSQRDDIFSNIQKQLYKNRSLGYVFGGQFSISDKSLVNISNKLIADYQKPSADFELQTVRLGMGASHANNTEIAQRLNELGVEKAKEVKYNANEITSEALLKIRKENPALFDKVVLEKEGAAKQAVASPVKKQEQVMAPPSPKEVAVASAQEQADIKNKIPAAPSLSSNYSTPSSFKEIYNAQEVLADTLTGRRAVKHPPPLPSDRNKGGEEVSVGEKEAMPAPRSRSAPPPRNRSQSSQKVMDASSKGQQGRRRPPPLPLRDRKSSTEVVRSSSQEQQGVLLHPRATPRSSSSRSRSSNQEGHGI